MKPGFDNRTIFQKLWCKLFHVDERFVDTLGRLDYHVVCIGHKCFKCSILVKKCWVENEFKEIIKQ